MIKQLSSILIQIGYFDINEPLPLQNFLSVIGRLGTLVFVIYPYVLEINELSLSEEINHFYIFLQIQLNQLQQILINLQLQNILFILLDLLLCILWLLILLHKNDKIKKLQNRHYSLVNISMILLASISKSLNLCFFQPLLSLILFNIYSSFINQTYIWVIIDIILLLNIHLLSLIEFIYFEGTLYIKQNSLKKLQITYVDYISFLLKILQPYIFVFFWSEVAKYGQAVIYLAITICEILQLFVNKNYQNLFQIKTLIIIHTIGTVISICILLQLEKPLIYAFLISPFINFIFNQLYYAIYLNSYLNHPNLLTIEELNLILCLNLNGSKIFDHKKIGVFHAIIINLHKKTCSDIKCKCRHSNNQNDDPKYFIFLPKYIEQLYRIRLIRTFKKFQLNQKIANYSNYFYIYCHYLSAFQQSGGIFEIYNQIENTELTQHFNSIQYKKWQIFSIIIKEQLYINFIQKTANFNQDSHQLSLKISDFLQSESFNQQVKDQIIQCIQKKIEYQMSLLNQSLSSNDILEKYYILIENLEYQEIILKQLYQNFPSLKNQSQLMFFYTEVFNDWLKSYDVLQQSSIQNPSIDLNLLDINKVTTQMAYAIFSYQDRMIKIETFSKKLPSIFGFDKSQFEKIKQTDSLIPNGVREIHNQYIEDFLKQGKGQFFRKKGQNILQSKSSYLVIADFFYDLYFDLNQNFRFITFFSLSENAPAILIIDKDNIIQGINKEFLQLFQYTYQSIEKIDLDKTFYQIPSTLIFPNLKWKENQSKIIENVNCRVPKEQSLFLFQKSNYNQRINLYKSDEHIKEFQIIINVNNKINYSIISILEIQDIIKFKKITSMEVQSLTNCNLNIGEEERILNPYESSDNQQEELISPLSQNIMIDTQRKTELKILSEFEDGMKFSKNFIQQPSNYDESEEEEETIEMLGNIYSLTETKESKLIPIGSYTQSEYGLRKSIFSKKYNLFNQLSTSKQWNPKLIKIYLLFMLAMISQTLFLIINIQFSMNDFQSLNYYYESIQINHYFIEPMQKFFLTRYMLQDYQIMFYSDQLDYQSYQHYTKFIYPLIEVTYEDFKNNYQNHFNDKTLSKFIENQYVIIQQQITHWQPIQLQSYNVTLYNAFSLLLDAFYKQEQIYIQQKTTKGTNPHNTYQYVNYQLFVTIFDTIADEILQESINQISQIVNKWINLVIPISVIFVFNLLLLLYYLHYYNQFILKKLFDFTQYIELYQIDQDQQRLKFIQKTLLTGSELIHKYKFNIQAKEGQLKKIKKENNKKISNNKSQKVINIINISNLLIIILIITFYFQYCLIAGPITYVGALYMEKFNQTIQLFKSLSDIGVYLPAAFSQKEILYFFYYFSYFTTSDREFYVGQIEKATKKIDSFLTISISQNNYQFSNTLLDEFAYLQQNNLCSLLNSSNYYDFDYYCSNSQSGVLQLGLLPTLTKLNNELKNELTLDFPEDRESPPILDLEAVYLCSDIITEITQRMSDDIQMTALNIETTYNIVNSCALTFTITLIVIISLYLLPKFQQKLRRTQQVILTFPLSTIFFDDHLERELRRFSIAEKLF